MSIVNNLFYGAPKGLPSTLYLESARRVASRQVGRQEKPMSKSIKMLAILGFVGVIAACGNNNEEEFVVVEPVTEEPTYTGKLK